MGYGCRVLESGYVSTVGHLILGVCCVVACRQSYELCAPMHAVLMFGMRGVRFGIGCMMLEAAGIGVGCGVREVDGWGQEGCWRRSDMDGWMLAVARPVCALRM